MVPFFQPLVRDLSGGHWYLAEDFAFCERARRAGIRILADTSIRLFHVGPFGYSWEDAGSDRMRHENYCFRLTESTSQCGQSVGSPAAGR